MQVILSSCDTRYERRGSNKNTHTQEKNRLFTSFKRNSEFTGTSEMRTEKNYFLITEYVNDDNNLSQYNMEVFIYLSIDLHFGY